MAKEPATKPILRFQARGANWLKRHPEAIIGVVGGIGLGAALLIFMEGATGGVLTRMLSWAAKECASILRDLDIGLH